MSDVYVVSDHKEAKQTSWSRLKARPSGYDAGILKNARIIERMTLLSGELG